MTSSSHEDDSDECEVFCYRFWLFLDFDYYYLDFDEVVSRSKFKKCWGALES